MSNVTALPPPAAQNQREAALQQARIMAMRIMGAAMLPVDALVKEEPQIAVLAHRLGAISTMAESLMQAVVALQPPPAATNQPGERTNA